MARSEHVAAQVDSELVSFDLRGGFDEPVRQFVPVEGDAGEGDADGGAPLGRDGGGDGVGTLHSIEDAVEGPAADRDGNVFFTDQPNDRIVKYNAADGSLSDWLKPAGRSNGLSAWQIRGAGSVRRAPLRQLRSSRC